MLRCPLINMAMAGNSCEAHEPPADGEEQALSSAWAWLIGETFPSGSPYVCCEGVRWPVMVLCCSRAWLSGLGTVGQCWPSLEGWVQLPWGTNATTVPRLRTPAAPWGVLWVSQCQPSLCVFCWLPHIIGAYHAHGLWHSTEHVSA